MADQTRPATPDQSTDRSGRFPIWPLFVLALPAFVAIWSGWVGLGGLCGFGLVHPLPGIADKATLNSAITLPIGMETYAAYALRAWLSGGVPARARRFAKWSAISSLVVGAVGQVAYHLMAAAHVTRAPGLVTVIVSCVPVAVLGMGVALAHLIRGQVSADTVDASADSRPLDTAAPVVADRSGAVSAIADKTADDQTSPVSPIGDKTTPDRSTRRTANRSTRHGVKRGPVHLVQTTGRLSIEDRVDILDRHYPDRIPGRNEAMRDLDWSGADSTTKAINELRKRRESDDEATA